MQAEQSSSGPWEAVGQVAMAGLHPHKGACCRPPWDPVKLDLAPNCQTLQHTTFANKVRELWIIGLKEIVVVLDFK